jgi:diguanylate cyclase (GGDEF)-like protein
MPVAFLFLGMAGQGGWADAAREFFAARGYAVSTAAGELAAVARVRLNSYEGGVAGAGEDCARLRETGPGKTASLHRRLSLVAPDGSRYRYLQIVMETRLESVEKGGEAFGLFMADIDHFKKVNDVHGHNIGDRVLTMVATTLGSAVRPLDAAVRWGGEEFILVCPKVPPKALGEIAERLRLLVEHCWLELEDTSLLRVTISLGATRARRGDTLENLVARADACLYRAKNSGRNRWVLDE